MEGSGGGSLRTKNQWKTVNIMSNLKKKLWRIWTIYKNVSIKRKLPLVFAMQIIVPLLLMGVVSFRISEDIIRTKSINYSGDLLSLMKFSIKEYASNLTLISQNILYEDKIYSVLNSDEENGSPLYNYQLAGDIDNVFKRLILTRSEIQGIYLISNGGNYYFSEHSNTLNSGEALPYENIITSAREAKGKAVWYAEKDSTGEVCVYLARTVHNQDNYREMGILVIQANKEHLNGLCGELAKGDIERIVIMTDNNEEIAGMSLAENDSRNFWGNIVEKNGAMIDHKQDMLITFATIEDPAWHIVTSTPLKALYSSANLLKIWVILLAFVSVVLLAFMSWFIAVDFLNPIKKLMQAMNSITPDGKLGQVLVDRGDELGMLGQNFNTMSTEINHLVKWIYQEQITRKDAELKALQAQVNPHFLFNTLEAINWMAQLNGVSEISAMVSSLSALMDASIGRDNKLITLEDEVDYIKKYMLILQMRFGEKLKFREDLDPQIMNIKVLRLSLQPLIENAVYHGLEAKKGKGIILLRARRDNDSAIIDIIDNGVGIREEELTKMNKKLSVRTDEYFKTNGTGGRKSIGIENTNRRIKLFYGNKWGVKAESKFGSYTKFTLTLPMQYEKEMIDNV